MIKWIKRSLGFLALVVVMFIITGKVITLMSPKITDYLASWFHTAGVEETTDLLFDLTLGIALILSMVIGLLIFLLNR